jgi:hypothetical protein
MKSRLFHIAHSIKGQFSTFGEALARAWKIIKLQMELCLCTVEFTYRKVDGSIRKARGTRDNVPAVKGTGHINYGVVVYFDLDAQAYRSAKAENIIF